MAHLCPFSSMIFRLMVDVLYLMSSDWFIYASAYHGYVSVYLFLFMYMIHTDFIWFYHVFIPGWIIILHYVISVCIYIYTFIYEKVLLLSLYRRLEIMSHSLRKSNMACCKVLHSVQWFSYFTSTFGDDQL